MRDAGAAPGDICYREAASVDVPAMVRARAADHAAGPADARMAAYLDGRHDPQQALGSRAAFIALTGAEVVGYIAGHATTRYGCAGELQYLYVQPQFRRRGIGTSLLRLLAAWFHDHEIQRVCVNADLESAGAVPFYVAAQAVPLNPFWYQWENIGCVLRASADAARDS